MFVLCIATTMFHFFFGGTSRSTFGTFHLCKKFQFFSKLVCDFQHLALMLCIARIGLLCHVYFILFLELLVAPSLSKKIALKFRTIKQNFGVFFFVVTFLFCLTSHCFLLSS
jgi:hypothetical protein